MTRLRTLALLVGAAVAWPAVAADPKPNLADLREAVAAADRKGENVEAIRSALGALEKALKGNALKAGEAPPELQALRDAVEMAAKKGENVAAISKELGAVEKALTGREYERPKAPEPAVEPVPPLRPERPFRRPGGVMIGGGGVVIGPVAGFNSRSISISNGNFTIKATAGDVTYQITGTTAGTEAPKFVITDGDKKIETDDLKKIPEAYRDTAERLLGSIRRP